MSCPDSRVLPGQIFAPQFPVAYDLNAFIISSAVPDAEQQYERDSFGMMRIIYNVEHYRLREWRLLHFFEYCFKNECRPFIRFRIFLRSTRLPRSLGRKRLYSRRSIEPICPHEANSVASNLIKKQAALSVFEIYIVSFHGCALPHGRATDTTPNALATVRLQIRCQNGDI